MAVPTSFTGLSTTPASNSPVAGDNVFPDLDDFLRIVQAMLASIYANTATNGWVAPYAALGGAAFTGGITGTTAAFSGATSGSTFTASGQVNTPITWFIPGAEPAGVEGFVYFDTTSKKLRCYDGTTWNDLF